MKALAWSAALSLLCTFARAHEGGERSTFGGKAVSVTISVKAGTKPGDVVWATPASDPMKRPFDFLFLQGITQNPDVVVQASVGKPGAWGPWVDAEFDASPNGRFWARIPAEGKAGQRVKLRAVSKSAAAGAVEIFTVHAAQAEEEAGGALAKPPAPRFKLDTLQLPAPAPAPAPTPDAVEKPTVLSRSAWGAKKAKKPYEPMVPVRISVHHTEAFQAFSKDDAANEMRVIQSFHQHGRGWIDIGYHYVIDGSGRIWEGRPLGVIGAHVKDKNEGNVGISLMGDFGPPHNTQPAKAQVDSLVALMRWLTAAYKIPVDRIKGHRDQMDTSCPGDILYAQLPAIRARVAAAPPAASPLLPSVPTTAIHLERTAAFFDRAR